MATGFSFPSSSLFLIWQKRDILERLKFDGSWAGVGLVLLGLGLLFLGELSHPLHRHPVLVPDRSRRAGIDVHGLAGIQNSMDSACSCWSS